MKIKLLTLTTAILVLLPCLAFALDFLYPAKIERVIDGDTIVVDLYLGLDVVLDDQYIRLYGIDAWEIKGEEGEKGLKAKEYLEGRLNEGERVEIEIRSEWGQNGKGKYGCWLGIVYVNGIDINAELVQKGHAEEYGDNFDNRERSTRMSNWLEILSEIAPFAIYFAAIIALVIGLLGIRATKKTSMAQLFVRMITSYSSEKMLRAMRKLIWFKKKHKENYAEVFGRMLREDCPEVMGWNAARRRFAHWRFAVHKLREYGFISPKLFHDLWQKNHQDFYEEYILPLEDEVGKEMEERRKDVTNEKTDKKTR